MPGSLESVRCNAWMHRLDHGLYSHPKEFGSMKSEPMFTPREKSPLAGKKFSSQEDRTHDAVSSRTASPIHYQVSYSGPLLAPFKVLQLSQMEFAGQT